MFCSFFLLFLCFFRFLLREPRFFLRQPRKNQIQVYPNPYSQKRVMQRSAMTPILSALNGFIYATLLFEEVPQELNC